MLGDGGVGKSCLTVQLCHGYFTLEYDPTIENLYRKQMSIDDETCMLEILDTAGQEDYAAMRDQHILQGAGFGLVYSITSRQSFQQMSELYLQILRVKDKETVPVVVFGNKCDVEKQRAVSTQEGREFAKKIKAPFFETSAKTRFNVDEGFMELVREVRKWKETNNEGSSGGGKKTKKGCIII